MNIVRVKARVAGPDANGQPRSIGEIFTMEEIRARKEARDGFVELIDENGQGVSPDAAMEPLGDSTTAVVPVINAPAAKKPKKKSK